MRLLCAAVAAALLTSAAPSAALSQAAPNPAIARLTEIVIGQPVEARAYGALAYKVNGRAGQRITIDLSAAGNKPVRIIVANTSPAGGSVVHNSTGRGQVETIVLPSDGLYVVSVMDTSFIPGNFLHTVSLENGSGQDGATRMVEGGGPAPQDPTAPRAGPIILSAGGPPPPQISRPTSSAPSPAAPVRVGSGGPIVLAAAPPPPAAIRQAPRSPAGAPAPRPATPNSREALMLAQVATRREQAAREAEAERQRQYQIAEAARIAEENRRAQAAADSAAWNEGLAFLGAVVGGVAVGMQTGGDMAGVSAGMAMGSAIVAPDSEIATASAGIAQEEMRRIEEQRAHEAAVIAELNNPNNPLTQAARRRDQEREAATAVELERIETEYRDRREAADRESLLEQRMAEAEADRERQADLQEQEEARDAARQEQQRRAEEQREREAQQAREEQERREEEARQRREQAEREAEARRQEEERRRAADEAERNRVIDFREAVVLCSLTGPQAQFNNWRCEGPLQMTYINFERSNVAANFDQISCADYRELPRAGPYRAFGCGYGIHPTNPGASRNVPEMLGVFVDGRATFRCPRNISGVCRER